MHIPVLLHVILSSANEGNVSDEQIQAQIAVLNQRYTGTDFSFYLLGIRRITNDNWRNIPATDPQLGPSVAETSMKNALAVAPSKVMNVYVTSFPEETKKGTSTYPWDYFAINNNNYYGVIIRSTVFPLCTTPDPRNDMGLVLIHEIGPVLGLKHTFFEGICREGDPDECPDTAPHDVNYTCGNVNNACRPELPPPVHNYMNYVTDECMTEFTNDQKKRMNQKIQEHRPNIGGTTITINNDITVDAGSSLQLIGNATLVFGSGKKIINNGTLSCSNIILTSNSSWGGIQFNSGSGGTIQYCSISNATQGIYIQETNSLSISNSEIFNCSGHAIYAFMTNYATQPIITNCVIHDNQNSTGIVMYWSSPDIRNCNVYNNYNGLGIADLSSPRLGHTSVAGNNNIHNNSNVGVYSVRYSYPLLGRNLTPFEAGNNIIASNTFRDIQAVTYCNVYAENNWWGSTPPNTTKIAALDGSTIDYDPYLSNPPSLSIIVANESVDGKTIEKRIVESELNLSTKQELLFSDVKSTDTEITTMISQLNALWREACRTDLKSFKTYLSGLSDSKEKKIINAAAKLILAGYEKEKRINMLEDVIRDYDKQPITETALMSKFLYYFNEQKDYKSATSTLTEISQKFPQSSALQEAQQHMTLIEVSGQLKSTNELQNTSAQQLNGDSDNIENYPNPFNPSTQISFTLKERANISLKVYDVLGKEVANLADGYYEAGKHTATFGGSNLASGIYFYRLTTHTATITKKMMLVK